MVERLEARRVSDGADRCKAFHSYEETTNAPPVRFAIEEFLQEDGVTLIGALAGHGKTLCMLAIVRALLERSKLFTRFQANRTAEHPECGLAPFVSRLKLFRLLDHVGDGKLFYRTLSAKEPLPLNDPRMLKAAEGADVFLDTPVRFMTGDENDAGEQRIFADTLFALQRAGARTITGAHHAPKTFGKENFMTLENILRGTGDIGAMLATCWGLRQIDADSNRIYVKCVKHRDFSPCEPFIIEGRPHLDQAGYFDMPLPPGFPGELGSYTSQGGHLRQTRMKNYNDASRACVPDKVTTEELIRVTLEWVIPFAGDSEGPSGQLTLGNAAETRFWLHILTCQQIGEPEGSPNQTDFYQRSELRS